MLRIFYRWVLVDELSNAIDLLKILMFCCINIAIIFDFNKSAA